MEIHYSKQTVKFPAKQDKSVRRRIKNAIENLPAGDVRKLWSVVERLYSSNGWDAVEEVEPDEIDLQMIKEARENPDCRSIASVDEVNAPFSRKSPLKAAKM